MHRQPPPEHTRTTHRALQRLRDLAPVLLALDAAANGRPTTAPDGQPLLPSGHAAPHRRLPPGSTPPDNAALRASDALRELDHEIRDLLRRGRLALGWGKHMFAVSKHTGATCPWCGQLALIANLTDRWVRCTAVDAPATARHTEGGYEDGPPAWDLDDPMVPGLLGVTADQLGHTTTLPDHDNPNGHDELPFNVTDHPGYQPGDHQ